MNKRWLIGLLFAALVGTSATSLQAQTIPPVQIGGGQSDTRLSNGQTVQVTTSSGVAATIYFEEISNNRVTGTAVRASGGSTSGTVTILWINRGRQVQVQLGPTTPEATFAIEGGDVDKRTSSATTE